MIKVAHIISGDLWAGAEVMTFNLMAALCKIRGLKIYAILLNEGQLSRKLRKNGIQVYVVNEKKLSFPKIVFRLNDILWNIKPDILHSHRYKENILAYFYKKFCGPAILVATQHGMPENFEGAKRLPHSVVTQLNLFLLKRAFQKLVCVSNDIKKKFSIQFGGRKEVLSVIHNGINMPSEINALNPDGLFRIGTAGRLFPVKDYPLFVKIAHEILKVDPKVRFLLAGEGPERARLQELVDKYNICQNFVFLGHVENMETFYGGLDLYLNTSVHEGIPMSVLEAMAHGVPVVAPKTGGLQEIVVDAKSGFLINSREPKEFADVCLNIIKDQKLYKTLSIGAYKRVETAFSAEHMAFRYTQLYEELWR